MRAQHGDRYTCSKAIWGLDTGSIYFCKKKQRTIFDITGPGVSLYFIFLKTFIVFFGLVSFLSLFLIKTNLRIFRNSNLSELKFSSNSPIDWLNENLVGSTIAAISTKQVKTSAFSISKEKSSNHSLSCASGQILVHSNWTQFGLISKARNPHNVNNYYEIECTNWDAFIYSLENCQGQTSCVVEFKPNWLIPSCHKDQIFDENLGFIKLYCEGIFGL